MFIDVFVKRLQRHEKMLQRATKNYIKLHHMTASTFLKKNFYMINKQVYFAEVSIKKSLEHINEFTDVFIFLNVMH